jgi:hypothetical protein
MKRGLFVLAVSVLAGACSKAPPAPAGSNSSSAAEPAASSAASDLAMSAPPASSGVSAHRYQIKSGIVQMTSSATDQMLLTLYFDDYGAKRATVTTTQGRTSRSEAVAIEANGYHTEYDAVKKTGIRRKAERGAPGDPAPGMLPIDVENMSESTKKQLNVHELPPKTIDGKTAAGYEMRTAGLYVRAWVWKGLPLYSEALVGATPIVVATKSVQADVAVAADKFEVPRDVKIVDVGL